MGMHFSHSAFVGTLALVYGCGSTSFTSNSNHGATNIEKVTPGTPTPDEPQTLKLECAGGQGEAHLVTALKGGKSKPVRLEGEFCGGSVSTSGVDALTVVFVIDWSGSMQTNDPLVNNSCGRLAAAQAVLSKIKGNSTGSNLHVGLVPFATGAMPAVGPTSLDNFSKSSLTPQQFCRADGGATNYDAAFRATQKVVHNIAGAKVVYFITDGVPTLYGDSANGGILGAVINGAVSGGGSNFAQQVHDAGQKSADALRAEPGLNFYALYLKDHTTGAAGGSPIEEPTSYLAKIAGDASHSRTAADAQDLAKQIQDFSTPSAPTEIDKKTATGTLTSAKLGKQPITISTIDPAPNHQGTWHFVTDPFILRGDNSATDNTIELSVKDSSGMVYKATAVISYTVVDNP